MQAAQLLEGGLFVLLHGEVGRTDGGGVAERECAGARAERQSWHHAARRRDCGGRSARWNVAGGPRAFATKYSSLTSDQQPVKIAVGSPMIAHPDRSGKRR